MPAFHQMTLTELVRPEGFDCACGKHHACPMDYLKIGPGAILETAAMVKAMGCEKPFVVCDQNTYEAAGKRVDALLTEAGIPHELYIIPCAGQKIAPAEWEVGSVIMHYDPSCDLILGVGSGVINDICKVVGNALGKKSAIIGTAPSMDGFASNSSAMEINHVKMTLFNRAPRGILLDTDILAKAPMRMLWAGLGDMAAKYIALCEWRMSNIVTGEYYCEDVAALMRAALKKVVDAAAGIPDRDPQAIQAIAEGLIPGGHRHGADDEAVSEVPGNQAEPSAGRSLLGRHDAGEVGSADSPHLRQDRAGDHRNGAEGQEERPRRPRRTPEPHPPSLGRHPGRGERGTAGRSKAPGPAGKHRYAREALPDRH